MVARRRRDSGDAGSRRVPPPCGPHTRRARCHPGPCSARTGECLDRPGACVGAGAWLAPCEPRWARQEERISGRVAGCIGRCRDRRRSGAPEGVVRRARLADLRAALESVASEIHGVLPALGISGLSAMASRQGPAMPQGLLSLHVHLDLVAWSGDRGFVGEAAVLGGLIRQLRARRAGDPRPTSRSASSHTTW